ncbi:MAG: beta-agarase, partial [Bacteroidetes bacterium]
MAGFDCVAHAAEIHIDPTVRCEIAGVGEMDRNAYINLADHGADFDERVGDIDRYNYLVHELDISFGRHLGPVKGAVSWQKIVREDPSRPGYADLDYLRSRLAKSVKKPSPRMLRDFGELDVACHENHNAFPEFMGQYTTPESAREKKVEYLPQNIDAAVELTAAVLKFGFNDFTRPTYYEPLNEPHWSMFGDEHFLKWHLRTKDMIHKHVPDVLVGGP